jgi:hypothetical protein
MQTLDITGACWASISYLGFLASKILHQKVL